jgi:hypothetical protein
MREDGVLYEDRGKLPTVDDYFEDHPISERINPRGNYRDPD